MDIKVLHVARVGSVAMRQLRVCLDFKIRKKASGGGYASATTLSAGQAQLPTKHQRALQAAGSADSASRISRLFDREHAPGIRQAGCPCCDPDNPSALLESMMNM